MRLGLDVSATPERPAGAGRYIWELAHRLGSRVELTVATRRDDVARWRGMDVRSRIAPVVPSSRAGRLVFEAYVLGRSRVVRAADVWHSPHYSMPHGSRTPVVVTIHDMTFFTHPHYHERRKVEFFTRAIRYAVREAAVLVAVSDYTARELRDICSVRCPIVVAQHGVDLTRFTPDPSAARGDEASWPYVLFVGTLEPRKGVDVLLAAFSELASEDPDLQLRLVGRTGWDVEHVEAAIRSHPFASRIRRTGYVEDDELVTLMRGARVVAYPSRGEGFGMPVLEALACGVPVVTTADTVMAEVAGDAATLVPLGDPPALARALATWVAASRETREEAAHRGRARAQLYSWDSSIDRHMDAYRLARGEASSVHRGV